MRLIPKNRDVGWAPYVWLCYLAFFFAHPVFDHVSPKVWAFSVTGSLVFLCLYFSFFWLKAPKGLYCIAGMVMLGMLFAPFNGGAAAFFIYAASFVPFAVDTEGAALGLLGVVVAIAGLEGWLLKLPIGFTAPAIFFSSFIGAGNIYFAARNRANCKLRRAQDEIEHLAKVAERERIARDLHDILGHTLSVIVLKSELAAKLIDRQDSERAGQEIHEVEQISRDALNEVRKAIGGYRATGLAEELTRAKATLETAGVAAECKTALVTLNSSQETVLALVVREAVTNVVRHAKAGKCRVELAQSNGDCHLEIEDDGRGGPQTEGNGIRGMRERIEALGGSVSRETSRGTRILVTLPLDPKESAAL